MEISRNNKNALVVDTESIETKIKKTILDDIEKGARKSTTDKKVQKLINEFIKRIAVANLRVRYSRSLMFAYSRWYLKTLYGITAIKSFMRIEEQILETTGQDVGITFNMPIRNLLNTNKLANPLIASYQSKVKREYRKLLNGIASDDAKDLGLSLRNLAEIRVRYEANIQDLNDMRASGIKLVWTSSYANSSDRCAKWQGQLFSLDGTYGTTEGRSYQPIENALNDNGGNSIINGYNCRHRLIPYTKGSTAPQQYTMREIKQQQDIDRKQRYMERQVLKYKEVAYLSNDEELKTAMKKKATEKMNEYRKYCESNKRTINAYRTELIR